jgi:hypothetical protein
MIQYLVTAVVVYISYKVYTWTRCPDEIKHLPSLPFWSFFRFALSNESYPEKMEKELQPMFDEHGVFRVRLANYLLAIFINSY